MTAGIMMVILALCRGDHRIAVPRMDALEQRQQHTNNTTNNPVPQQATQPQ